MPRGIYKRKVNDISPKEFVDTLVAGFNDPSAAADSLSKVADLFEEEAQQLRLQLEILNAKISRITELRDTFERSALCRKDETPAKTAV